MSDKAAQGTGAYLMLAVESLESQLTAAEATMREVAEELRALADKFPPRPDGLTDNAPLFALQGLAALADRLDPPPVVEKPLHAYFPSDVDAGSRSPCVHCGQAYDAHVPPPVVENPPA